MTQPEPHSEKKSSSLKMGKWLNAYRISVSPIKHFKKSDLCSSVKNTKYIRKYWPLLSKHTALIDSDINHTPHIETLTFCFVIHNLNMHNEWRYVRTNSNYSLTIACHSILSPQAPNWWYKKKTCPPWLVWLIFPRIRHIWYWQNGQHCFKSFNYIWIIYVNCD